MELLFHDKLSRSWFLKNTDCFSNSNDFFVALRDLKEFNLITCDGENINKNNPKLWRLTFKGELRAKLLGLDKNNPKDYTKNLKDEIIEFEYNP